MTVDQSHLKNRMMAFVDMFAHSINYNIKIMYISLTMNSTNTIDIC